MNNLFNECRRRRIFQVAAFYVVGVWALLQVASLAFESWGIPPETLQLLWLFALAGFPLALFVGWQYDFRQARIVRTAPQHGDSPLPLRPVDHAVLATIAGSVIVALTMLVLRVIPDSTTSPQVREAGLRPSIAVLPFEDMSSAGDQRYLGDGIAEELLNRLANLSGLTVVSRSSAFALRDAGLTVPEIASRLGVSHVLEGSVRESAGTIRITAQLIEVGTDSHLWSSTYDRDLTDVFEVQDAISLKVARELEVRLLSNQGHSRTVGPESYQLYLRGLAAFARRGEEGSMPLALSLFADVTEREPDFAPAWGSLALARYWNDESTELVFAAADRCIALDPDCADGYAAIGRDNLDHAKVRQGREQLLGAIEANPNHALATRWLAISYSDSDPPRYYALIRRAFLLDPLDSTFHFHIALSAMMMGRYEEALGAARELYLHRPDWPATWLAVRTHLARGAPYAAYNSALSAYRSDPGDWAGSSMIAGSLADLGEFDLAEKWLDELVAARGDRDAEYILRTMLAALRGQDKVVRELVMQAERDGFLSGTPLAIAWGIRARDYGRAIHALEQTLPVDELMQPDNAGEHLAEMSLLAMFLARSGRTDEAEAIVALLVPVVEKQVMDGVVHERNFSLSEIAARLYALRDDDALTLSTLRRAAAQGYLVCRECLLLSPRWDDLLDDPEFQEIVTGQLDKLEKLRQRLDDEGLLLTPQQVRELDDYSFDPFEL